MRRFVSGLVFAVAMLASAIAFGQNCRPAPADCPNHTGRRALSSAPAACLPTHMTTPADCDASYPMAGPPPVVVGTRGNTITLRSPLPPRARPARVSVRDPYARREVRRVDGRVTVVVEDVNENFGILGGRIQRAENFAFSTNNTITNEQVEQNNAIAALGRGQTALGQQTTTAVNTANAALAADAAEFRLSGTYALVVGGVDFGGGFLGAGWRHRFGDVATLIRGDYGVGFQSAAPGHGPLHMGRVSALVLFGTGSVQGMVGLGGSFGGYIGRPSAGELSGLTNWSIGVEGAVRFQVGTHVNFDVGVTLGTGSVTRVTNGQASEHNGLAIGGSGALVIATN